MRLGRIRHARSGSHAHAGRARHWYRNLALSRHTRCRRRMANRTSPPPNVERERSAYVRETGSGASTCSRRLYIRAAVWLRQERSTPGLLAPQLPKVSFGVFRRSRFGRVCRPPPVYDNWTLKQATSFGEVDFHGAGIPKRSNRPSRRHQPVSYADQNPVGLATPPLILAAKAAR